MSKPKLIFKRTLGFWGILATSLILLAIPLSIVSDLFLVPKEVSASRKSFKTLHNEFLQQPQLSLRHMQELARMIEESHRPPLEEIPSALLVAYLYEHLRLDKREVSIFPGKEGTLIFSKCEEHAIPVPKIILSLEVRLVAEGSHLKPELISVRRGERKVATDLAWAYFGPELQLLEQLGLKLHE
ncbi:MAG: hypothetical protein JSR80_04845 [Verrucomicrobia bacterium]|nr:hypothetical protein [Verrucomicrobiota bacterium]